MSDEPTQDGAMESVVPRRVELLLGVGIAFLLLVVAIPGVQMRPVLGSAETTVRGLEGLLVLARDEALRTGKDHIVLLDVAAAPRPAMALLFRDLDGNGLPSEAEQVASVPLDREGGISWGSALADRPAIGDAARVLRAPWSFSEPGGRAPAPALLFGSDGVPHAMAASGMRGAAGSGAGSLYLHSATQDYAVVLSPWGDVAVQIWDGASDSWQFAGTP